MPDWGWAFKPLTTKPRSMADLIADEIDKLDNPQGDRGYVKPFIAGSVQGMGDVLSDMTSPFSLATMAAGPLYRGARGLGRIGSLAMGEAEGFGASRLPQIGRRLADSEKMFNVTDEAGRALTNPGGYAGPAKAVSRAQQTPGSIAAEAKLAELRTPQKTRVQPPRDPSKTGVDFPRAGKKNPKPLRERIKGQEGVMKFERPGDSDEVMEIVRDRVKIREQVANRVPQRIEALRETNHREWALQRAEWIDKELQRMGYKNPDSSWKMEYQTSKDMDFEDRLYRRPRMNETIKKQWPEEPD